MKSDHNISSIVSRIVEVESLRASLSLILSLAVVLTMFKIPWQVNKDGISWQINNRVDQISFVQQPEEIIEQEDVEGGIITVFEEAAPEEVEEEEIEEEEGTKDASLIEDEPEPIPDLTKIERIDSSPVLEFVDQSPSIIGGLSSLYLNIDYPLEARDQGIQGLTILMFIVEKDGSTSDIEVIKSLHPACDSAAVAAVSQTLFKPGVQDGKEVRVKMRLPIRFKLVKRSERYNNAADSVRSPS
ncbi:MAG: energy transducer TonB [Rhodothermaceae bacterium]|nr:energy transducer TonB [Rhodothermaceae bacterium]